MYSPEVDIAFIKSACGVLKTGIICITVFKIIELLIKIPIGV